jgi:hypothetical protein
MRYSFLTMTLLLKRPQKAAVWLPVLLLLMFLSGAWMFFNTQFSIGEMKRFFSGASSPASATPDRRVVLSLSTWGNEGETQTLRRLLQRFEASHPDIRVQLRHMPEFYTQSLQMLIAAGQTPDIMMLNSLDVQRFCDAGLLVNLAERRNDFDFKAFKCYRTYFGIKHSMFAQLRHESSLKFYAQMLGKSAAGGICPHWKVPMLTNDDGNLECPYHGLIACPETEKIISTVQFEAYKNQMPLLSEIIIKGIIEKYG